MSRPVWRAAGVVKRMALCRCSVLYQGTKLPTQVRASARLAKGLCGKRGQYFRVRKRASGKRVVIAHAGTAEGRHDAQPLQGREHGGPFHGGAVVRVQNQPGLTLLVATSSPDELGGQLVRLALVDRPGHDLAAPDVLDQVEVIEGSSDRRAQVRDVPAPDLVRAVRDVLSRCSSLGWARSAPVLHQAARPQEPIDCRFRGQVDAAVGQRRNDLFGRGIAKLGRIHDGHDRRDLRLAQSVRWRHALLAAVVVVDMAPALQRPGLEAHLGAGPILPGAGANRLVDEAHHFLSSFSSVESPSSSELSKRAASFFRSTNKAVTSARALSLRATSRSSSWTRRALGSLRAVAG